jgi:DNA-binding GntR family transcriptional regulator
MTEIAMTEIKEAILNGVYEPGTRLIPSQLEKDLNLGKVAIREALRELAGSGLVNSIPNKGAIVPKPIPIEEIKEVFEIRYLLEGKAAYLATQNISIKTLEELEELHRKMCSTTTPHRDYFFLNKEFHMLIYLASGWNYLCQIITQLIEQVRTFRIRYQFRAEDFDSFNKDHEKILKAIKKRNPKQVRELTIINVRKGFETLLDVYKKEKKPDKF